VSITSFLRVVGSERANATGTKQSGHAERWLILDITIEQNRDFAFQCLRQLKAS